MSEYGIVSEQGTIHCHIHFIRSFMFIFRSLSRLLLLFLVVAVVIITDNDSVFPG